MISLTIKGLPLPSSQTYHANTMSSIYIELAEQYGLMDAASNISKRNVLADHLREVIDILEQKVREPTCFDFLAE